MLALPLPVRYASAAGTPVESVRARGNTCP